MVDLNPNGMAAPAAHPGDALFAAIKAGLSYNNAHEDEYLAQDLARDPCFLKNKPETDPSMKDRIAKAADKVDAPLP